MLSKAKSVMLSAFLITAFHSLSAQSLPTGSRFYVEIPNLQVESYTTLYQTLKSDGKFEIETACIPAHVLTIVVKSETDLDAFKQLAAFSGLNNTIHLAAFNEELFESKCLEARRQ